MNGEKRFFISIDGGGSKTGICVYDCETGVSSYGQCGGGNYKVHGIDTVKERINRCLYDLIPEAEDIPNQTIFLVMGLSGCDSVKDQEIYAEMITSLGFDPDAILICNDSEMIFRALTEAPGICAIAGTGTIALSFEQDGTVQRAGGWGAPLSDEGSGYWIGASLIRAYMNWIDGTGPFNEVFPKIQAAFPKVQPDEIAAEFGALSPDSVADWAKLVFENAAENEFCAEIISAAGRKAAALVESVYHKSGFASEPMLTIVESGSLFKNELFESGFQSVLFEKLPDKNYTFIRSNRIPAEDGIRLAMKMANVLV